MKSFNSPFMRTFLFMLVSAVVSFYVGKTLARVTSE